MKDRIAVEDSRGASMPTFTDPVKIRKRYLGPRPHDTDSAIWCVITYGICSPLPPYASMLWQQLEREDSSERPLRTLPFGEEQN